MRLGRRILTRTPGLAPVVLLFRRWMGSDKINRVLVNAEDVYRHYGLSPETVTLGDGNTTRLTTLRGARVSAQPAAIIGADGALLWPFAPQLKRRPFAADALWRFTPAPKRVPGRALYAAADGFSYYHWLLGTLPRVLAGLKAGGDPFDVVVVNPKHPRRGREGFQLESLRLLGVPASSLLWLERGTHVQFESLTVVDEPCADDQTELEVWARDVLRSTFLPLAVDSSQGAGPERIYVSRARARRRKLLNEGALIVALQRRGFVPVILEEMTFIEQVRLFAGVKEVLGLHGAGLANLVFAPPGASVMELLPKAWPNPCFAKLARVCGLGYQAIDVVSVGPRKGFQADALVDVDAALKRWGQTALDET